MLKSMCLCLIFKKEPFMTLWQLIKSKLMVRSSLHCQDMMTLRLCDRIWWLCAFVTGYDDFATLWQDMMILQLFDRIWWLCDFMTGYDDFATGSFQRIKFAYRNIARYTVMWTFRKLSWSGSIFGGNLVRPALVEMLFLFIF